MKGKRVTLSYVTAILVLLYGLTIIFTGVSRSGRNEISQTYGKMQPS